MSARNTAGDPPHSLVTDAHQLAELTRRLRGKPRIALDTEAASFHRYVDRVYLVQVSSDDETALIDPLAVEDLSPIGDLLADPGIETIFHDADYDLRILDRDYGFRGRSLWDTRIAAQLAGETAVGLGALLEQCFGITLSKKLQRADWSQRPLTDAMTAYAAADTAHLPALRDRLAERLTDLGRMTWAQEEFARLERVRWTPVNENEAFLRLKGAKGLPPRTLAVLRSLWTWRDDTARSLDRAPFRVLGNAALVAIARAAPGTQAALMRVEGMPASVARRQGAAILDAVRRGGAIPEADWPSVDRPRRPRPDPSVDARYQRLRALRAERAATMHLDPGQLCPNATLQAIARAEATSPRDLDGIEELRDWQREALGETAILATADSP